jgi:hypothetical protein
MPDEQGGRFLGTHERTVPDLVGMKRVGLPEKITELAHLITALRAQRPRRIVRGIDRVRVADEMEGDHGAREEFRVEA